MNEKEKMIEEMAKDIFNTCAWRFGKPNDYKELCKDIAEDLIKSGYRKIIERIKLTPVGYGKENGCYYADISVEGQEFPQRIYFQASLFEREEIQRETAKEFAEKLKSKCKELEDKYSHLCKSKKECLMETCRYEGVLAVKRELYEIAKQYGVVE